MAPRERQDLELRWTLSFKASLVPACGRWVERRIRPSKKEVPCLNDIEVEGQAVILLPYNFQPEHWETPCTKARLSLDIWHHAGSTHY